MLNHVQTFKFVKIFNIMPLKQPVKVPSNLLQSTYDTEESPKVFMETYGCQMNVNDSEVVIALLKEHHFQYTSEINNADLILINTCSIRENAEQRIRGRLDVFRLLKKKKPSLLIGVIGCMAERLKEKLLEEEKMVDLVAGPDSYRELHKLVKTAGSGQKAINVLLSREETYADISPVRMDSNHISAFVSIMRGCNNMCAYCVVPYTRGGERSRESASILKEIQLLMDDGYKEVTLLGQNVDSYKWKDSQGNEINFPQLLTKVAQQFTNLRIRFSTSHPKDMNDEVLLTMAKFTNICQCIHLPAQSGSSQMLEKMKRGYTRDWYIERIASIRRILPESAITTDIITGFCSETEEDHQQTLSLLREVKFDLAYMFKYSERPNTFAQRKYPDDVPEDIKSRRLQEIIDLQRDISTESKKKEIGKVVEVLVEGFSKKSREQYTGRTPQNKPVVFPKEGYQIGDLVLVKIEKSTASTLLGKIFHN